MRRRFLRLVVSWALSTWKAPPPFRTRSTSVALVFDFLTHHARMLAEWADRTENTLDSWDDPRVDRQAGARASINANLEAVTVNQPLGA